MEIALAFYVGFALAFFIWAVRDMKDSILLVFLVSLIWPLTILFYLFDKDE